LKEKGSESRASARAKARLIEMKSVTRGIERLFEVVGGRDRGMSKGRLPIANNKNPGCLAMALLMIPLAAMTLWEQEKRGSYMMANQ